MALRSPPLPLRNMRFQALGVKGCLAVWTIDNVACFHQLAATDVFLCHGRILPAGQHISPFLGLPSCMQRCVESCGAESGTAHSRPAAPIPHALKVRFRLAGFEEL